MGPLPFQPSLSSRQVPKAPCKHTRLISFPPYRHCASLTKRRNRSVAVLVRPAQEQQVAHDAVLLSIVGISNHNPERMNAA
jgi:hypothetical protein